MLWQGNLGRNLFYRGLGLIYRLWLVRRYFGLLLGLGTNDLNLFDGFVIKVDDSSRFSLLFLVFLELRDVHRVLRVNRLRNRLESFINSLK